MPEPRYFVVIAEVSVSPADAFAPTRLFRELVGAIPARIVGLHELSPTVATSLASALGGMLEPKAADDE
jgi:hypothetical protein